jgi:hypothetical protein
MTPPDSFKARTIASRSASLSVAAGFEPDALARVFGCTSCSGRTKSAPADWMTPRSITFCSSRMLPGQVHRLRASITAGEMDEAGRPSRRAHWVTK